VNAALSSVPSHSFNVSYLQMLLILACIECGAAAAGTLDATYLLQEYTSVIDEFSSLCSGVYAAPTVTATAPSATPSCGTAGRYITITSDADLMSISNCITITGDLIITTGSALTSIDLPTGLQSVTGSLVFDGQSQSSATSISAAGLSSVGSSQSNGAQSLSDLINTSGLVIGNFPALGQFAFPNLATISSNLVVEQNPQLNTVTLPVLSTVGDNIDLTGDFNSIQLPDLQSVGGGVNVQSQSPSFQCPANLHTATKGSAFTCQGNISQPVPGHDLSYNSTGKKSIATKTNSGISIVIISNCQVFNSLSLLWSSDGSSK